MSLPTTKRHVIPPAVEAERMRRYSVLLMLGAFALLGVNAATTAASVEPLIENLLWFGALLLAIVAIVLATGSVIMRGLQWHYDRLVDEFRGIARVRVTDLRSGGEGAAGAL